MTCISAIKSPIVLKMVSNGCYGNIIPSCTTLFKLFDILFTNFFELCEKIKKNKGGIRRKMHISWLLKDLESSNWYQIIARTMFYDHVISNI